MPHTPTVSFLLAAIILLTPLGAGAACPPAVADLGSMVSVCGGPIRLTFTPPAGQLVFPQVLRANIPALGMATVVGTGTLNATFYDDVPPSNNIPFYYWVRWMGLDSACPLGPLAGPIGVTSFDAAFAGVGAVLPAPQVGVTCSSVTLTWGGVRVHEATSISIMRGPHLGSFQTIATLGPTATTFTDTTGTPGVSYDYLISHNAPSCGVTSQAFAFGIPFPPTVPIPTTTCADVAAGEDATLSAAFSVLSPGLSAPARWFRGPMQVMDVAGRTSGAGTTALRIIGAREEDEGIYTLRMETACGPLTPINVALIVRAGNACRADFNADAQLDVDDIFGFLNAWFAGCP